MPFLAPLAPSLIGAAGSIIGGLIGGKKSNLEKGIANLILPSLNNLTNWAGAANAAAPGLESRREMLGGVTDEYTNRAREYEPIARGDLGRASKFYNGLLSPSSNEALSEILGPQRQGVMAGYQNVLNTIGRTGPRGGGRNSGLMNFDFAKNTELMNLIPQARMQAAQGLLNTSGAAGSQASRLNQTGLGYGNLGLAYGQQALGYRTLSGDLSKGVLNFANGQPQKDNSSGALLGGYIGDLIGGLIPKRGKAGASQGLSIDDFSRD